MALLLMFPVPIMAYLVPMWYVFGLVVLMVLRNVSGWVICVLVGD